MLATSKLVIGFLPVVEVDASPQGEERREL